MKVVFGAPHGIVSTLKNEVEAALLEFFTQSNEAAACAFDCFDALCGSQAQEMLKSQREWKGETGLINKDMLARYLPTLHGPTGYVAGPLCRVAAMRRFLTQATVDRDDIRTEGVSG